MAAWGAALYADDTACDVRDDYINHLKRGASDAEAAKAILDSFGELLRDRQIECLVYFALADTAWKYGRLGQGIQQHALKLIEEGGDVFIWERDNPPQAFARKRALTNLTKRLLTEQPARREVKAIKQTTKTIRTEAEVGTVFLLPLTDEVYAALVLIGYKELEKSIEPNFVVLDWRGSDLTSAVQLADASRNVISFHSGLGPKTQLGILASDNQKNPIMDLVTTSIKIEKTFPFEPFDTVYISPLSRVIQEISVHFAKPKVT